MTQKRVVAQAIHKHVRWFITQTALITHQRPCHGFPVRLRQPSLPKPRTAYLTIFPTLTQERGWLRRRSRAGEDCGVKSCSECLTGDVCGTCERQFCGDCGADFLCLHPSGKRIACWDCIWEGLDLLEAKMDKS